MNDSFLFTQHSHEQYQLETDMSFSTLKISESVQPYMLKLKNKKNIQLAEQLPFLVASDGCRVEKKKKKGSWHVELHKHSLQHSRTG